MGKAFIETLSLQPNHGLVAGVLVGGSFVLVWAALAVGAARKKYNVHFPNMYADDRNPHHKEFNCIQRAHQNILENYPVFIVHSILGSVIRPEIGAALAAVRLFGFISYAKGYQSGEPKARINKGTGLGLVGLLGLTGLSIELVVRMVKP